MYVCNVLQTNHLPVVVCGYNLMSLVLFGIPVYILIQIRYQIEVTELYYIFYYG